MDSGDRVPGRPLGPDLPEDLTDLMVAARSRGRGVLLAIDEVQYLAPGELAAVITAIHRITQLSLPVLLVGAGLPQLIRTAWRRCPGCARSLSGS